MTQLLLLYRFGPKSKSGRSAGQTGPSLRILHPTMNWPSGINWVSNWHVNKHIMRVSRVYDSTTGNRMKKIILSDYVLFYYFNNHKSLRLRTDRMCEKAQRGSDWQHLGKYLTTCGTRDPRKKTTHVTQRKWLTLTWLLCPSIINLCYNNK